jgi:hypothetical protein
MAEFLTLMAGRSVVTLVQIVAQLAVVMRDAGFIPMNIATVAPTVIGEKCACAKSHQQ